MSKAEERALEYYPIIDREDYPCKELDEAYREVFLLGYHQAEQDLALTWENIKEICDIAFEEACRLERNMKGSLIYKEQHYQEVLKRFKERKDKL